MKNINNYYGGQQPAMAGQANPWIITADQWKYYERLFTSLNPKQGYLSGEQGRNYLMQSNLPSPVLAHIWGLSDLDGDGRLTFQEFSIAMHLIQNTLRGTEVPRVLPYSLKSTKAPPQTVPPQSVPPHGVIPNSQSATLPTRTNELTTDRRNATLNQQSFNNWSKPAVRGSSTNVDGAIMQQLGGLSGIGTSSSTSNAAPIQAHKPTPNDANMQQKRSNFTDKKTGSFSSSFDQLAGFPATAVSTNFGNQDIEQNIHPINTTGNRVNNVLHEPMPQNLKVKYTQVFNRYDRAKTGFIQGPQARDILSQSRLPQQTLIQIWNLSDIDNDGRLTAEEFSLALYLCDLAKDGIAMPESLPPELVPISYVRRRSSLRQSESMDSKHTAFPVSSFSLEERKKQNFEQGRLELERRRQELQDKFRKEQEERMLRESEEEEKRQKERMDQERKKLEALERYKQQQEAIEREKEAQHKAQIQKRLAEQLEKERQRQKDWEDRRREQLNAQKRKDEAVVKSLTTRLSELQVEFAGVNGRRREAEERVSKQRSEKEQCLAALDMIKSSVTIRKSEIDSLKAQCQEFKRNISSLTHEREAVSREFAAQGRTTTAVACDSVTASCKEMKATLQRLQLNLHGLTSDTQLKQTELSSLISHRNELSRVIKKQQIELGKLKALEDKKRSIAGGNEKGSVQGQQSKDLFAFDWGAMEKNQNSTAFNSNSKSQDMKADAFGSTWGNTKENESNNNFTNTNLFDTDFGSNNKTAASNNSWGTQNNTKTDLATAFDAWSIQGSNNTNEGQTNTNSETENTNIDAFGLTSWAENENQKQSSLTFDMFADTSSQSKDTQEQDWKSAFDTSNEKKKATLKSFIGSTSVMMAGITMELTGKDKEQDKKSGVVPYTALYDYVATQDDEISFELGDTVMIHEGKQTIEGWLYGENNGKQGLLPENYVQKISQDSESATYTYQGTEEPSETQNNAYDDQYANLAQLKIENSNSSKSSSIQSHTDSKSNDQQLHTDTDPVRARAMADYDGTTIEDLSFKENDIITINERPSSGWWSGELNGKSGLIPSTFVEIIESISDKPVVDQLAGIGDDQKERPSSVISATYEGVDFAFEKEEYVTALYDYRSGEAEDLQFNKGDKIRILSCDGNWWKGTCNGKTGSFPSNYVELDARDKESAEECVRAIANYTAQDDSQISFREGDVIRVLSKEGNGWWEGDLQNSSSAEVCGWFPASYVEPIDSNDRSEGEGDHTPAFADQVLALYDYKAVKDDELSFHQGNLINVIEMEDNDWWQGEVNGTIGYFPANHVELLYDWSPSANVDPAAGQSTDAKKMAINEFISTEESYLKDLLLINELYIEPMKINKNFSQADLDQLFINWSDIIVCSSKLIQAIQNQSRRGEDIEAFATVLRDTIPTMLSYALFCSRQMAACKYLQEKNSENEFKEYQKQCSLDPRTQGLPLSSFLLKPMQRATRYPLLIERILKYTTQMSPDFRIFNEAKKGATALCKKINESVIQTDNTERLKWIQLNINCSDLSEEIVFNSKTNCLGMRKVLHSGTVIKIKSSRELLAVLCNDFLLLAKPVKSSTISRVFFDNRDEKYNMYRPPLMLNEVNVRKLSDDDETEDQTLFHVLYRDKWLTLKVEKKSERDLWVKKIVTASHYYKKVERQQSEEATKAKLKLSRLRTKLTVIIIDATDLTAARRDGKSDPYVQAMLGGQKQKTKVQAMTTSPKWNSSLHFYSTDVSRDKLLLSVFHKRYYAPDECLGHATIPIPALMSNGSSPWKKTLQLTGAKSGILSVRINIEDQPITEGDDIYE